MVQHCDKTVAMKKALLHPTEDRLYGQVARWGWCAPCKIKGVWTGYCGRGHVLQVASCRRQPYSAKTRYGEEQREALVCQEGDCFEYDQAWLKVTQAVEEMSYDDFDAWVEKTVTSAKSIKYTSPKTTWQQQLLVDVAQASAAWQHMFKEQREQEEYDAKAKAEQGADAQAGVGYPAVWHDWFLDQFGDLNL